MYDIYVPPAHDGFVVHDTPTRERGASFAASLNLCFYPAPTPPARDGSARPREGHHLGQAHPGESPHEASRTGRRAGSSPRRNLGRGGAARPTTGWLRTARILARSAGLNSQATSVPDRLARGRVHTSEPVPRQCLVSDIVGSCLAT